MTPACVGAATLGRNQPAYADAGRGGGGEERMTGIQGWQGGRQTQIPASETENSNDETLRLHAKNKSSVGTGSVFT